MATDSDLDVALRVLHALRQRSALHLLDEALGGLGLEPVTVTIPASTHALRALNDSVARRRANREQLVYVPRDAAAGEGGRVAYRTITPGAQSLPLRPEASGTGMESGRSASTGHLSQAECCRQGECRRWPRMLLRVARLARKVVRIACGTSVGAVVVGGSSHRTNGGSAPKDEVDHG